MPVYSKEDKHYLFIHIPKTAGTTVEATFRAAGFEEYFRTATGTPLNRVMRCTPQHFHGALLRSVFRLRNFDGIFTLVRDPYARIRSEFAMRHRDPAQNRPEAVEQWLRDVFSKQRRNPFTQDNHIRPQADFMVPKCQVFRLEDGLEAFFRGLEDRFGIRLPFDASRQAMSSARVSGYPSTDVPLSDRSVELINRFYACDFDKFRYGRQETTGAATRRFGWLFSGFKRSAPAR